MDRRTFLRAAGAGTIVVAGGVVWRVVDTGVVSGQWDAAYEPWTSWRSDTAEGPRELVRAAILAANPHNSQPWMFRLGPSRIDLFADTVRNIGAIDPRLREMYTGLGCAVENLLLAAEAGGMAYKLTLMPDPADTTHVARVELSPGEVMSSDLYSAIPNRHTNRGPYDKDRAVAAGYLNTLTAFGRDLPDVETIWITTEPAKTALAATIVRATAAIIADRQQSADSARWMRMTSDLIHEHRDGLTLDATGLSPFVRAAAKILPPQSAEKNDQAWLEMTHDVHVATAAAFGVVMVRDVEQKHERLNAGRLYQRMHLWATTQHLAMHPLSQITERSDREMTHGTGNEFSTALKHLVPDPDRQVLMIFRIGYPLRDALASPRRSVEQVIV